MEKEVLLSVENLTTAFEVKDNLLTILNDVNFNVYKGESLGVVGESGSGKSVTAMTIMGLLPSNAVILNGKISFLGEDLLSMKADKRRRLRGDQMGMIFQEPMTSLNPVYTVGDQISELIRAHRKIKKSQAFEQSIHMLEKVGIPKPASMATRYPHELSGGMRQRVVIALAMSLSPKLLIADEPTTALDVSIQAQILDLMASLQDQMETATMLITHDLGVVATMCKRVVVMYAGEVVEIADTLELFKSPLHPYTNALMKSIPKLDQDVEFLSTIRGVVPHLSQMPKGCRFSPRCEQAQDQCFHEKPGLTKLSKTSSVRCLLYAQE